MVEQKVSNEAFATDLTIYYRMLRLNPKEYRDMREIILEFLKNNPHIKISFDNETSSNT